MMTRQCSETRMNLAFASFEDQRGDGPGVIPPDFLGHASEELEGGNHPFENGFGALEWESQDKRSIGVGPGSDEERDEPSAVRKINVDVTKIGFEAVSREVAQWDESLAISPTMLEHIALNLSIAAGVLVLIAKTTMDLGSGVPLLVRGGLVVDKDLVDDRLDRTESGSPSVPNCWGRRFGMFEDMPDGFPCVSKLAGDLSDGHAIATSSPNRTVVVHREHVLNLRECESIPVGTFTLTKEVAVGSS
jgi:hypothetical protein